MDNDAQEYVSGSARPMPRDPGRTSYGSAMFSGSQNFTVTGQTFTNITNNYSNNAATADFRLISLGDIDLQDEMRVAGPLGMVRRRNGGRVRRVYSAKVVGVKWKMTVAVYQGDGAEEEWRAQISRYLHLRHPYLCQLYGVVNTGGLHAAVFHDNLIPYQELLENYRNSHFSTVFVWICMREQFQEVDKYMSSLSGGKLDWTEYIVWIRPSTGRLCLELVPQSGYGVNLPAMIQDTELSRTSLLEPPADSEIIPSVLLEDYHGLCERFLSRPHSFLISTGVSIKLGSIRHFSSPIYESSFEIACVPDTSLYDSSWSAIHPIVEQRLCPLSQQEGTLMMENGWTRVNFNKVKHEYRRRIYTLYPSAPAWLAQAKHILDCLDITSSFEDYGKFQVCTIALLPRFPSAFMDRVDFRLRLVGRTDMVWPGYLFLCPLADLQSELPATFRVPDCPAYWSLHPSGARRLSTEQARDLELPDIELRMAIGGRQWHDSVYAGIRQFQEAKGFDPCSQEVALALGWPLYRISCDRDALSAHLEGNISEDYYSVSDTGDEDHVLSASSTFDEDVRDNGMDMVSSEPSLDHSVELAQQEIVSSPQDLNDLSVPIVDETSAVFGLAVDAENLTPSRSWNIVIAVQLTFIIALCTFSLCDLL
ncbi:hypothetical protein B0H12DRAFT_1143574 [Mycena haematopus]|nr:hypothetical protein B0H12DRAFT_1143574 [Mycena haematopus]